MGSATTERFELANVVTSAAAAVGAAVVEPGAEVGVAGAGSDSRCQMITRMERPMVTLALLAPRRRAIRQ